MSAKYFEYYTIMLGGGAFFSWTRCISWNRHANLLLITMLSKTWS